MTIDIFLHRGYDLFVVNGGKSYAGYNDQKI